MSDEIEPTNGERPTTSTTARNVKRQVSKISIYVLINASIIDVTEIFSIQSKYTN